jgi:large subunit ribosomal protein L7/L12
MTLIELSDFVKKFEDTFRVAAAPPPVAAPLPARPTTVSGEETATGYEFDVILSSPGPNKVQVIKTVRELTQLGLREAKELVDQSPQPIARRVGRADADRIRLALLRVGADVVIE